MNGFFQHHAGSIRFSYRSFDRIFLNAFIQPLQTPASIVWFLKEHRNAARLTKDYFRQISVDYHDFVQSLAKQMWVDIVQPPQVRREDWVEPYYHRLGEHPGVAVILRTRENARIAVSESTRGAPHIELKNRFVWQYYFYVNDAKFGRMFLRICPYFPFNARVCLNGHGWLAYCMRERGIRFRQCKNALLTCSDPDTLQRCSDLLCAAHMEATSHYWFNTLLHYFTRREQRQGYCHRLYFAQVEYATNIIFHRRACLDKISDRLLDENRSLGRPDRLSVIFGRRITRASRHQTITRIKETKLGNPVIHSAYKSTSVKQYVRDHLLLRTETTSNCTRDLGIGKSVENLPLLRDKLHSVNDRYLDIQQDILETFIDHGEFQQLRQATVSSTGRRTPGLNLDDPRLLSLMQSLTQFAHIAAGNQFRTKDIHAPTAELLGKDISSYTLAQLRYDLGKLRAKGLVQKVAGTQSYCLTPQGYRICVLYLKLYHKLFAPLTAAAFKSASQSSPLPPENQVALDRLYSAVDRALNDLIRHIGIAA
jgi:hypothetical protein